MTRETKVGLVVASSFVGLVAVVVATKFHGGGDASPQTVTVAADSNGPTKPSDPPRDVPGAPNRQSAVPEMRPRDVVPAGFPTPGGDPHAPAPMPPNNGALDIPPPLPPVPGNRDGNAIPPIFQAPPTPAPENDADRRIMEELKKKKAMEDEAKRRATPEGVALPGIGLPPPGDLLPPPPGSVIASPPGSPGSSNNPALTPPSLSFPPTPPPGEPQPYVPARDPLSFDVPRPSPAATPEVPLRVAVAADPPRIPGLPPPPSDPIGPPPIAPPPGAVQPIPAPVAPLPGPAQPIPSPAPIQPPGPPAIPPGQVYPLPTPPLGSEKPPLAADVVNPNTPNVKVVDLIMHTCDESETSFPAVSAHVYGSDKYGTALFQFNRDKKFVTDDPRLTPGQKIWMPRKADFLVKLYPNSFGQSGPPSMGMGSRPNAGVPPIPAPSSVVDVGPPPIAPPPGSVVSPPPGVYTPPVAGPLPGPTPPPVNPSAPITTPAPGPFSVRAPTSTGTDGLKHYRVPGPNGQHVLEIAQTTLGDRRRWWDIYHLNPTMQPQNLIPAGTDLVMPADARVP